MDKDLQRIEGKIDKLAEVVASNTQGIQSLTETVIFIKDRVAKTEEKLETLATKGEMKMLEGHMNVIEQKLDTNIERHTDLEVRVTRLESAPAQ